MVFESVTQIAYYCAAVLSLILALIFVYRLNRQNFHWSLSVAVGVQALWALGIALRHSYRVLGPSVSIFEVFRAGAWIIAATLTTQYFCNNRLPLLYKRFLYTVCIVFIALAVGYTIHPSPQLRAVVMWQSLLFSIIGLLSIEQMYRNINNIRLIKLLCLTVALIFIYDIYYFSQSLLQDTLDSTFSQFRAILVMVSCVLLGIAAITLNQTYDQPARLSLSRPIVFYSTSLILAGAIIAVMAVAGYYVRSYGSHWGALLYGLLLLLTLLSIGYLMASNSAREKLSVLINKHLFSHKYDYRAEWLKLIDLLSQPKSVEEVNSHALHAVASIFRSHGGAIWMQRGKLFVPVYQKRLNVNIYDAIEPDSSPFIQALQKSEWVFLPTTEKPNDSLAQYNDLLPEWVSDVSNLWLILPLMSETQLVGFMALTTPNGDASLNWEDLDLLKTVGRQVANYLRRHEQSEQLAEARQFDAFNKLAAYVMHDLKNLIAQQSLVVKNAEKHKDNPAFVEDTINTINNSVTRMNNLLRKLQRNEPESVKILNLQELLLEAVRRCQKGKPLPSLRNDNELVRVKGDFDSLTMVFVHLIQNAQDATAANGFIDVSVTMEGSQVSVAIEDNGEGMDQDFIRDRLFRPFDTTKTGKGMGIGVYQARDYIQSLGGQISVHSAPGEGSTFTITLPVTGQT